MGLNQGLWCVVVSSSGAITKPVEQHAFNNHSRNNTLRGCASRLLLLVNGELLDLLRDGADGKDRDDSLEVIHEERVYGGGERSVKGGLIQETNEEW